MLRFTLRETALAGLIAAVYALLSLFFAPISFAVYQIRIAEALTVIPYLSRAAIPGLFVGCALANQFGSQGWPDIVFGSLLTLVAAILTRLTRGLKSFKGSGLLAALPVVALWTCGSFLLMNEGWSWLDFGLCIVAVAGGVIAGLLQRSRTSACYSCWIGLLLSVVAIILMIMRASWIGDEIWSSAVGAISTGAALLMTLLWIRSMGTENDPSLLLAPLPPVLVNAFGVPAYLAPMYGLDYWFAVQMIGVGQLIACYLLGLPLLRVLQRRGGRLALGDNPGR